MPPVGKSSRFVAHSHIRACHCGFSFARGWAVLYHRRAYVTLDQEGAEMQDALTL